ncbi:MAG: superoxide dismutase [Nanoarchaeota archaeon]
MFSLPNLPYSFDALEPYIDAKTMEIHHDKHHKAYVDKLNAAVEGTKFSEMDIVALLKNIEQVPKDKHQAVINHGGGHANHSLFWEILSDNGGEPSEELLISIEEKFESFEKFKELFSAAATGLFGSGWVWLVVNQNRELEVRITPNQNSPYMDNQTPILGLDVWEHAYYLKYQNKRTDYIAAFFNIINWDKVSELFNATQ